jgi:hypothetical protein
MNDDELYRPALTDYTPHEEEAQTLTRSGNSNIPDFFNEANQQKGLDAEEDISQTSQRNGDRDIEDDPNTARTNIEAQDSSHQEVDGNVPRGYLDCGLRNCDSKGNRREGSSKGQPNPEKKNSSRNILKKYSCSYFKGENLQLQSENLYARYSKKSSVLQNQIANVQSVKHKTSTAVCENDEIHRSNSYLKKNEMFVSGNTPDDFDVTTAKSGKTHQSKANTDVANFLINKRTSVNNNTSNSHMYETSEYGLAGMTSTSGQGNSHGNSAISKISIPALSNLDILNNENRRSFKTKNFSERLQPTSSMGLRSLKGEDEATDVASLKDQERDRRLSQNGQDKQRGSMKIPLNLSKNLSRASTFLSHPTGSSSFRKTEPTKNIEVSNTFEPKRLTIQTKFGEQQSKSEAVPFMPLTPNIVRKIPVDSLHSSHLGTPSQKSVSRMNEPQSQSKTQQQIEELLSANSKKIDPKSCFGKDKAPSSIPRVSKFLEPHNSDCTRCEEKNTPISWRDPEPEPFKNRISSAYRQSANSIVAEFIKNPSIMSKYSSKKENIYNDDYKQALSEQRNINELKVRQGKMKHMIEKEAADVIKSQENDIRPMLEYNADYVG